jgi:arylsulfatase A-like enzyme
MGTLPNILFIMTDQQRGDCLGMEHHPVLLTPNMDNIAGNGARFTRCYSTCPVCVPARRSLLTGQYPATHGFVSNVDGIEWDAPTLPGELKKAGYHTYLVGRDMHQYPYRKRHGFDHMVTIDDYSEWLEKKAPEIYSRKSSRYSSMYQTSGVMHNDWTARPWHMEEEYHLTNWTINEALKFLDRRDPSGPFFLMLSFLVPHPPLTPPAFYMERYLRQELPMPYIGEWALPPENDGRGLDAGAMHVNLQGEALKSCRAAYYGLINHLDDQLRRVINPVTGINLVKDRETIIIFTSDHGEMLGDHYLYRKKMPYEGSMRIPLLIRAPEQYGIQKGMVIDQAVSLEDIFPTIMDMVDLEIPDTVEGRSLLPLCRGESGWHRDHLHSECSPNYHCLTDGTVKYIWFVQTGQEQFFDLKHDPHEYHDLSDSPDYSQVIEKWRGLLIRKLRDRPEGFSDGGRLIPGNPYKAVIPGTNAVNL